MVIDPQEVKPISWVFHPCDFQHDSASAFAHALKIALLARGRIGLMHALAARDQKDAWRGFPGVSNTLEKWQLLPPGSERADVPDKLGLNVQKLLLKNRDPVMAIDDVVNQYCVDLMVLATEGRAGIPSWLKPSVAEPAARRAKIPTLFVSKHTTGFVNPQTGELCLRRILIPVDRHPDARTAVDMAARLVHTLGVKLEVLFLLHVGTRDDALYVDAAALGTMPYEAIKQSGDPVARISEFVQQREVDLIITATAGHHGFLDALRGSTSEQVLRLATCPVLTVPSA